ncbi:hypothetical protein [Microvirga aerophila]|uniref:Uncharacterized protein n=1 Tax=Microvirga aerophila TaxID=670291 RepID=A0A512C396_9HYPH|nr:hypothetical protein [Microvirga aerophila]GEO18676.1 hypothetical protein MAE02_63720 [Microvirga aerophila]
MPDKITVACINGEWAIAHETLLITTRSNLSDAIPIAIRLAAILSRSSSMEVEVHNSSTDFYTLWQSDRDALSVEAIAP